MNRLGNEVERGVTEMKGGGINTFRKNVIQDVGVTLFTCESILYRNLHPPPLSADWLSGTKRGHIRPWHV
jgi:hypothetical protein